MKHHFFIFIPFIAFLAGFVLMSFFIYEQPLKTPSLLGHSVTYALRHATDQGFTLKILSEKESTEMPPGTILAQKPIPGALIKPKQAVFVTISKSPHQTTIPNFTNLTESAWQKKAQEQGITVKNFTLTHHTPVGMVIAQSPEDGVAYDHQVVELFVSSGPETRRIMPNVVGQQGAAVQEFLECYGIGTTLYKEPWDAKKHADMLPGTIIAQKPLAGAWIDLKKPLMVQLVVQEKP